MPSSLWRRPLRVTLIVLLADPLMSVDTRGKTRYFFALPV